MAISQRDVPQTVLFHLLLFILILVILFYGFIFTAGPTSDQGLMTAATQVLIAVPVLVFPISVIVSVILLARDRRAFYIPLLAGAVVIVSAVLGFVMAHLAV